MKRLIDRVDGVETWFHSEPGGEFTIQTVEDAEPVLDYVKAIQDHGKGTWQGDSWRFVGRVPRAVFNFYLQSKGMTLDQFNADPKGGAKLCAWLESDAPRLMVSKR